MQWRLVSIRMLECSEGGLTTVAAVEYFVIIGINPKIFAGGARGVDVVTAIEVPTLPRRGLLDWLVSRCIVAWNGCRLSDKIPLANLIPFAEMLTSL